MALRTKRPATGAGALPESVLTRTLVLWCPDWPLTAAQTAGLCDARSPVALIDHGEVFACSSAARREGVRRGLRVREAQARCSFLTVLPYDAGLDTRMFEPVLAAIEQLMPGVQPIRPGMCAIASRGPGRYYGGERPAALALLSLTAEHSIPDARVGIADGPFAAEHAARRSDASRVGIVGTGASGDFLASVPVDVLGDPPLVTLLLRLGMRTLGDLARLGERELRSRFGESGTRIHALASGRDARAVLARAPRKNLERSVSFEPGLDRIETVAFGFRAAADDFVGALTDAGYVATAVLIRLHAESGEVSERVWLHPRWFTAADVVDRVRWQLQGTAGETGIRSPIVQVTAIPESIDPLGDHEAGLWGDGPDERIHHALSRVQSILGHEAVLTAVVGGGRLLAGRQVLVPWGDRMPEETIVRSGQPWPGSLPDPLPATVFVPRRPVGLFDATGASVRVSERGVLSAEPAWFSQRGSMSGASSLRSWAGPWPVDERWWDAQRRSLHRVHLVDEDGMAWLLVLDGECGDDGRWEAEARYD